MRKEEFIAVAMRFALLLNLCGFSPTWSFSTRTSGSFSKELCRAHPTGATSFQPGIVSEGLWLPLKMLALFAAVDNRLCPLFPRSTRSRKLNGV